MNVWRLSGSQLYGNWLIIYQVFTWTLDGPSSRPNTTKQSITNIAVLHLSDKAYYPSTINLKTHGEIFNQQRNCIANNFRQNGSLEYNSLRRARRGGQQVKNKIYSIPTIWSFSRGRTDAKHPTISQLGVNPANLVSIHRAPIKGNLFTLANVNTRFLRNKVSPFVDYVINSKLDMFCYRDLGQ